MMLLDLLIRCDSFVIYSPKRCILDVKSQSFELIRIVGVAMGQGNGIM
jgi:hypothetical protein